MMRPPLLLGLNWKSASRLTCPPSCLTFSRDCFVRNVLKGKVGGGDCRQDGGENSRLAGVCRETQKGPAGAGSSPGGTTDVSPGCSGAARAAQRNPGNPEESTQAPEGREKPALNRESTAFPSLFQGWRHVLRVHPGFRLGHHCPALHLGLPSATPSRG